MSTPSDNHPKMHETITSAAHPPPSGTPRPPGSLPWRRASSEQPKHETTMPYCRYPSRTSEEGEALALPLLLPNARPPAPRNFLPWERLSLATVTTGPDPDDALPCLRLMMPSKPRSLTHPHTHTRHPVNSPRRGHETREPPSPPAGSWRPRRVLLVYRCPAVRP
jgi:hypothetical protein